MKTLYTTLLASVSLSLVLGLPSATAQIRGNNGGSSTSRQAPASAKPAAPARPATRSGGGQTPAPSTTPSNQVRSSVPTSGRGSDAEAKKKPDGSYTANGQAPQSSTATANTDYIFYGPYPTSVNFNKGSLMLGAGLGILGLYYYGGSSTVVPPLFVLGEYGVTDRIGLGGILGYSRSRYRYSYFGLGTDFSINYLLIAARGTYHFYQDQNWDTYAGLSLGYNAAFVSYEGEDPGYRPSAASVRAGLFVGGRYFFNPQVAAMAELGYQIALLNVGVVFKVQ